MVDQPIPQQFSALAAYLAQTLAKPLPEPGYQRPADWEPAWSAEFWYGNGNASTTLLNRGGPEKCALLAGRLRELGCTHTVLSIPESVFRHERAADFLEFYRAAIATVRTAGLEPIVETACPFLTPPLQDYGAHVASRQRAVETIAGALLQAGDTLIVADEDSEARLTGFRELRTPAGNAAFVKRLLEAVPYPKGILIGAGAGTWQTLPWHDALLGLGLDTYSAHHYSLAGGATARLCAIAERAAAQGIRVGVGEAWCQKSQPADALAALTRRGMQAILARDAYSLWDELDSQFLRVLVHLARSYGFAYLSPFWSLRFWAGLPWKDGVPPIDYDLGQRLLALAADRALRAGQVSPLGTAYKALIAQGDGS